MASGGTSSEKKDAGNVEKIMSSFGLPRLWHTVDISSNKFLLPEEKLNNPPSLADGMDADLERDLRFLGCELIQAAAILLKMPQVAAATAQILYQRYYYSKSFVRNNFEDTAMACLVLASKIEEAPRRNRDIINVFHHLKQLSRLRGQTAKRPSPLILDQKYVSMKNLVIKAERRVLKELGFVVHVKHPHKLITGYLKALDLDRSRTIIQKSWNYMNDALRTDIFVRYSVETIACACIFLAARVYKVPLPVEPLPWWELFSATEAQIVDICKILLAQYTKTKSPSWRKLEQRVVEIREKLQAKQKTKATEGTSGKLDGTPNHSAADRFSPSVGGRAASPGRRGGGRKQQNGEPENRRKDYHRGTQGRRSRSRSGSSPPSSRKRDLPKRYSVTKERRSGKKRRRSRSPSSPPFRSKANRQIVADFDRNRKPKKSSKYTYQERSPPTPPIKIMAVKEKGKDRDKNSRLARKEREREVKLALGKRHRASDSNSPPPAEKREKSGKYR